MVRHVTAEAIANNLNESNSDMEIITGNDNRELDSIAVANMMMMVALKP